MSYEIDEIDLSNLPYDAALVVGLGSYGLFGDPQQAALNAVSVYLGITLLSLTVAAAMVRSN